MGQGRVTRLVPFREHLAPFSLPRQPLARDYFAPQPSQAPIAGYAGAVCKSSPPGKMDTTGSTHTQHSIMHYIRVVGNLHAIPFHASSSAWSECHQPGRADFGSAPPSHPPNTRVVGYISAAVVRVLPYGISVGKRRRAGWKLGLGAVAPEYENGSNACMNDWACSLLSRSVGWAVVWVADDGLQECICAVTAQRCVLVVCRQFWPAVPTDIRHSASS